MRYIYTILFLICTLLAKAQGYESYSVTCLSSPFPIYKEVEKMNMHKGYEQTIYWKKHKKFKKYAFSALWLGVCGTIVGWIGCIVNISDTDSDWKNDGKVWHGVLVTGIGLTVSSIPLFVISHKYKKRIRNVLNFH